MQQEESGEGVPKVEIEDLDKLEPDYSSVSLEPWMNAHLVTLFEQVWEQREYVYGPEYVDEFILQVDDAGRALWMLQDANYNVVALVRGWTGGGFSAGQTVEQYVYAPYGEILAVATSMPLNTVMPMTLRASAPAPTAPKRPVALESMDSNELLLAIESITHLTADNTAIDIIWEVVNLALELSGLDLTPEEIMRLFRDARARAGNTIKTYRWYRTTIINTLKRQCVIFQQAREKERKQRFEVMDAALAEGRTNASWEWADSCARAYPTEWEQWYARAAREAGWPGLPRP